MGRATQKDLLVRTKAFALHIVKMYMALPKHGAAMVLGRQVLKSGTSVGAQYREAQRARSKAEFVSKVESATQEMEETVYWLELLTEAGLVSQRRMAGLLGRGQRAARDPHRLWEDGQAGHRKGPEMRAAGHFRLSPSAFRLVSGPEN